MESKRLIKRVAISVIFFVVAIYCFLLIYKIMTGRIEFNRISLFLASMIGVICLYISLHVLKQG